MDNDSPGKAVRDVLRPAYVVTCLAFVAFAAIVSAFAKYGGPWVDGLDDRIGDVVAGRARARADAGREDEALALYRQALTLRFDDEGRRIFTSVDYARLLIRTHRFGEAFDACASLVELDESYARRIFRELQEFLVELGFHEERLRYCGPWREIGLREDREEIVIQALSNEAYASLRLGRRDREIRAFADLFRLRPDPAGALSLSQALIEAGRGPEAIPYLEFVMENAEDERRTRAIELLRR